MIVASTQNAAVKAARRLARPAARSRGDALLVEGPQAVSEALGYLSRLFVTTEATQRHAALVDAVASTGAEVIEVTEDVLGALAGTRSPQGLVGVADLPPAGLDVLGDARLAIVCQEVADPGNAGTIVRTADAAGADAVVLGSGSVDIRNPKAVRASTGSVFHLPIIEGTELAAATNACRAAGMRLVAADAGAAMAHTEADLSGRVALVFGSEAHGLHDATLDACDEVVSIPIRGRAESLNLAASVAVMAFEVARQQEARPAHAGGRHG